MHPPQKPLPRVISVDDKLEELAVSGAVRGSDIYYIKASVDNITVLLKEQNGRIRKSEHSISRIQGAGYLLSAIWVTMFSAMGAIVVWLRGE